MQVRSRTGQELQDGISSLQARDREAELFRTHSELKLVAQEYKGVPALSRKLVQIQAERIQSHLPALQKEVIVHKGTTCFFAKMLMLRSAYTSTLQPVIRSGDMAHCVDCALGGEQSVI